MQSLLVMIFVTMSFSALAESMDSDGSNSEREDALSEQFHSNMQSFGRRLDDHLSVSAEDDEWSPRAEDKLLDWFQSNDDPVEVVVVCVEDMCAVDFLVSYKEFLANYREKTRQWEQENPEGYLHVAFYFPGNASSIRLFVFRETFNPATL